MAHSYYFETGWVRVGNDFIWGTEGQTEYYVYDRVSGKPNGSRVKYVYRGELGTDGKPLLRDQHVEAVECQ